MSINYNGQWHPVYVGAKLTFVQKVACDEFFPDWPEEKNLGENDLFGSVEIRFDDDDLIRLKRFIKGCESELRIGLTLIMDKENWKSLMKGHHNKMLLSMTFEDESHFDAIDGAEPLGEEEES